MEGREERGDRYRLEEANGGGARGGNIYNTLNNKYKYIHTSVCVYISK